MLRLVLTAAFGLLFYLSYGQLKKFYSIRETSDFDTVEFTLEATAGNCAMKVSDENEGPLSIYGNPNLERINPSFNSTVVNNTCIVDLNLREFRSSSLKDGIMYAMLKNKAEGDNSWKVLFDEEKIYRLNLNYGFGNADVDLTGTAVQNFKIRSGSADVMVGYSNDIPNRVVMDTFYIKVDMGSIKARQLELTRAKYINANIGFGSAVLDFGSKSLSNQCNVRASVGAGNLDIYIPGENTPVIIYMKDSPLCGTRMADGFEEVEKNVYINRNYTADAENLMVFNIDVALGNVSFHYAK